LAIFEWKSNGNDYSGEQQIVDTAFKTWQS